MERQKLPTETLASWLKVHSKWKLETQSPSSLTAHFEFQDFSETIAFITRVALAAEKYDHHPDVQFSYNKASVLWSTHDANGITERDTFLAELTERYASAVSTQTTS